jgi:hypothetical protein
MTRGAFLNYLTSPNIGCNTRTVESKPHIIFIFNPRYGTEAMLGVYDNELDCTYICTICSKLRVAFPDDCDGNDDPLDGIND